VIIQYLQAWFSSLDAKDWMRFRNPDAEVLIRPVQGQGLLLEVTPTGATEPIQIGMAPQDVVGMARFLLAHAHLQGANVNTGIEGTQN
jgi:hypothetical protein